MAALAGGWRRAVVAEIAHPYRSAVVLRLAVPDRIEHVPGQHHVIRLPPPDGYTASRSYSVSSPPSDPLLETYIERIEGGEVSGYLAEVVSRATSYRFAARSGAGSSGPVLPGPSGSVEAPG